MFHNIHAKITCQHAYLITTDIKKNSALAINRKCGILYTYRVISQICVSTG